MPGDRPKTKTPIHTALSTEHETTMTPDGERAIIMAVAIGEAIIVSTERGDVVYDTTPRDEAQIAALDAEILTAGKKLLAIIDGDQGIIEAAIEVARANNAVARYGEDDDRRARA